MERHIWQRLIGLALVLGGGGHMVLAQSGESSSPNPQIVITTGLTTSTSAAGSVMAYLARTDSSFAASADFLVEQTNTTFAPHQECQFTSTSFDWSVTPTVPLNSFAGGTTFALSTSGDWGKTYTLTCSASWEEEAVDPENLSELPESELPRGTSPTSTSIQVVAAFVGMAVDGNRDNVIDFTNTADTHCTFWVNDDHDERHFDNGHWVEDDSPSGAPDCNDNYIGNSTAIGSNNCKRDLEDFTRLHIRVDPLLSSNTAVTYFMKFDTPSSVAINVFEAVSTSTKYLSDIPTADRQIEKKRLITVDANEIQLPNKFIKPGGAVSPFIFEGRRAGAGNLLFLVKIRGVEVCRASVNLELRPITDFYDKYVVDPIIANELMPTVQPVSRRVREGAYHDPQETDEYFIHVHGWNMLAWEKNRWSETVFKRLWWQGYKGRVGSFQWPTYEGLLTYDASEVRAWRSAPALLDLITHLNQSGHSGQVRVLAHSMGNVVMGETLRLASPGMIHTYIAAQAAIPAHCYDNTIPNYWHGYKTPDVYGGYTKTGTHRIPYLAGCLAKADRRAQYFNPGDFALTLWELNNEMKPDAKVNTLNEPLRPAYGYKDGDKNRDSYDPAHGDMFYWMPLDEDPPVPRYPLPFPDQRYLIFARCAESRSKALGKCGNAPDVDSIHGFSYYHDLRKWEYDAKHYSHSREFRSDIATEWRFWSAVITDSGMSRFVNAQK